MLIAELVLICFIIFCIWVAISVLKNSNFKAGDNVAVFYFDDVTGLHVDILGKILAIDGDDIFVDIGTKVICLPESEIRHA